MASIKGFLEQYFKQLHFNAMSPEVQARFDEYLKKNDLTNSMKDWRKQLMHETAPKSGQYVPNELPSIEKKDNPDTGLTDDQISELYSNINNVVSGMAADKKLNNAEFGAAKTFIDDFYGTGKLFHIIPLKNSVSDKITNLFTDSTNANILEDILRHNLPEGLSYDEFMTGLKEKKYNKDAGFREKLVGVIRNLGYAKYELSLDENQMNLINQITSLKDELDPKPADYSINRFKREYGKVLERLYKKSKVKDLFAAHDAYGITSALDSARGSVDYDKSDSANYLYPKTVTHRSFGQNVKKKFDDFKENRLQKWHNLGGDYMFKEAEAEDIVKAMNSAKIKRTDGLAAVVSNVNAIKQELTHKTPRVGKHFDWFIKEMNIIKEADGKAFDKALSNGIQLRRVVERVMMDAVRDDKIAEAKTTLNILSAIKYENTTSKTLDAIKNDKELFNIFSNNDLSFNKNSAVKVITGALDKTIRVAGIAVATGATFMVNTIRKMGSKVRNEGKDLAAAHNAKNAEYAAQKAELAATITNAEKLKVNAEKNKAKAESDLNALGDGKKIDANFNKKTDEYKKLIDDLNKDSFHQGLLNDLAESIEDGMGEKSVSRDAVQNFLKDYMALLNGKSKKIPSLAGIAKDSGAYTYAEELINTYVPRIAAVVPGLMDAKDKKQKFADATEKFTDATDELQSATDELTANQKEMDDWDKNHKDKYEELRKYWNDLEFGRDMHLPRVLGGQYSRIGSKKNKQTAYYDYLKQQAARSAA